MDPAIPGRWSATQETPHGSRHRGNRAAGRIDLPDGDALSQRFDEDQVQRFRKDVRLSISSATTTPSESPGEFDRVAAEHDNVGDREEVGEVADEDALGVAPDKATEGPAQGGQFHVDPRATSALTAPELEGQIRHFPNRRSAEEPSRHRGFSSARRARQRDPAAGSRRGLPGALAVAERGGIGHFTLSRRPTLSDK